MARILVIDDEEPVRRLIARALALEGHVVTQASHGKEGLQLYHQCPVDLVITDLIMPERDGIEVITALRRETPGIKIIAMSGGGRFGQMESLQMAEPLGAGASLQKPFEIETLLQTVRHALAA